MSILLGEEERKKMNTKTQLAIFQVHAGFPGNSSHHYTKLMARLILPENQR